MKQIVVVEKTDIIAVSQIKSVVVPGANAFTRRETHSDASANIRQHLEQLLCFALFGMVIDNAPFPVREGLIKKA